MEEGLISNDMILSGLNCDLLMYIHVYNVSYINGYTFDTILIELTMIV